MIELAKPLITHKEIKSLQSVLESGWLTHGPMANQLEQKLQEKFAYKNVVLVSSGTAALHLMMLAANIGPGDEILVPAFTWVATANAVKYVGAKPVFVDIDPKTYNIDPTLLTQSITTKTKGIIAVHLFGLCADISPIQSICKEHNLMLFEDAACATGASYCDTHAGKFGLMSSFSLHPRKSITTGEGGYITTESNKIAKKLRSLRNHGLVANSKPMPPHFMNDVDILGYNYRISDLQAAVGLAQLDKLDEIISAKQTLIDHYYEVLDNIPWLHLPTYDRSKYTHAWQAFVTFIDENKAPLNRNEIMMKLLDNEIMTRPGTQYLPGLSLYKNNGTFPHALSCYQHTISLPLHPLMDTNDIEHVATVLKTL